MKLLGTTRTVTCPICLGCGGKRSGTIEIKQCGHCQSTGAVTKHQPLCGVVLSIRQPWAWLIANGLKDVENRTWPTRFRGEFFIHAGKSFDADGYRSLQEWCEPSVRLQMPHKNEFELGGIVGRARIVDCVEDSESNWFFGPYGFVMEDAQRMDFRPLRGQLGFFEASF
jgi:hypothetical protein